MAARKIRGVGRGGMSGNWKDRIQAGQLANRLMDHFEGTVELSTTQIQAAKIIFDKIAPNLASTQHSGDSDKPIKHEHTVKWEE